MGDAASQAASEGRPSALAALRRVDGLFLLACALFVASSIVRTALADFPKSVDVMPDELRYLDLARSLFLDGTLTIRGDASSFQKILYPLSLLPAMVFPDPQMQVRVIALLSSVYASSAVFPAYVLAKRIVPGRLPVVLCLFLAVLLPDVCYSMTFMSESLYLPLSLWLMALLWDALVRPGRRGLASCLAGGALCYAAYLCKEIALAYVIAASLMLAGRTARAAVGVLRERGARREERDRENPSTPGSSQVRLSGGGVQRAFAAFGDPLCRLALFLIGFLLPFLVMKLTLFSGLANSYSQSSPDILRSLYVDLFALYALGQNAVYFLLGFAFFPLALPFVSFRHFSRRDRTFLLLVLLTFAVSFLTVVFTISMREDAGHVALRQHLRYVGPLLLPLSFFLVRQATVGPRPAWGSTLGSGRVLTAGLAAFCVGVLLLFGTANLSQGLDSATLHVYRVVCDLDWTVPAERFSAAAGGLSSISDEKEAVLAIDGAVWAARAVIVATVVAGTALFFARGRAGVAGRALVVCTVAAFFVANTVACTVHNRESYGVEPADVQEAQAVDAALSAAPATARVLIVYDDGNTAANNLVTTYVPDRRHTYVYLSDEDLAAALDEDGTLPETVFGEGGPNAELFAGVAGPAASSGDSAGDAAGIASTGGASGNASTGSLSTGPTYIVVHESQGLTVASEGALKVSHEPQDHFIVYRVPAGEPIVFEVDEGDR